MLATAIVPLPRYVTLRYVTLRYVTLRYVTLRYVTLRYVTLRYVTLRYVTSRHVTSRHVTSQYSTVQYSTVQYSTVQYSTVQYSTVQYNTIQYRKGNSIAAFVKKYMSKTIVNCCAEVFILVNYLYLVIVDENIRLGWRLFPKINAHVFSFCCVQAQKRSITPCNKVV